MTIRPYHQSIPAEILALSHERDHLRRKGQYARADVLKQQIEDAGFAIKDNPHGAHLIILPGVEVDGHLYRTARHLPSLLDEPDRCTFSVNIVAHNNLDQARRCVESVFRYAGATSIELILVDNASQDELDHWAEDLRHHEPRMHVLRTTRKMGLAEARNIALRRSRGRYVLLLDANLALTGDIFQPLAQTLSHGDVGLTGLRGLRTNDLRHFAESQEAEVDVIDATCMAVRRKLLKKTDLFDERYRVPTYMDIDFSFALRDNGAQAVRTPDLPVTHQAMVREETSSEAEIARLNKRNFYRFLEKWGDRDDLVLDFEGDEDEYIEEYEVEID